MPTKLMDFRCVSCGYVQEYLCHGEDDDFPDVCPNCDGTEFIPVNTGGTVTKCHNKDTLKEVLTKRSAEHTASLVKKEAGHRGTLPPDLGRRRLK